MRDINMWRQRLVTMKFLRKSIITVFALCVLAAGAMASEPQKDGQKPPPPKPPQTVEKPPKEQPPRNNGNSGNNGGKGGNDNRRGRPE